MSLRDGFQPVVALDHFNFCSEPLLQFRLLRIVQILVFENLGRIPRSGCRSESAPAARASCKTSGTVAPSSTGLLEIVFRNVIAEPLVGLAFAARATACR